MARFSYRIARENSIFRIQYGTVPVGPNAIIVPYHGEVFVDDETHMVLRLTQQAEIPPGFPISANESTVDYEFAAVGGKQYLLPTPAYVKTRSGRYAGREQRGVPRVPQVPDRSQHHLRSSARQTVTRLTAFRP